jgi:hypothetical protein
MELGETKKLDLTISSAIDQTLSLVVRRGIETATADQSDALANFHADADAVTLHLTAGHPLTIHLTVGDRKPSDWIAGK